MESTSDQVIFEQSVSNIEDPVLFQDKKYTYIVDSSSNSGSFSSGQIQFDLSTFSNQSQWISLKEAVVEIPYKITGKISTSATGTGVNSTAFGYLSATMKNGWHQIIDSAQLVINGQTIQSAQPYENISAQFKILSTWSQDNAKKWGTTLGFALDDCTGNDYQKITSTTPGSSEEYYTYAGLSNVTSTDVLSSAKGLDVVSEKAQNYLDNKGALHRTRIINNCTNTGTLNQAILGSTNVIASGLSNVATASSDDNVVNNDKFCLCAMATIRLKDICNIDDFPLTKNLKGFLYLSFNSFSVELTGTVGTGASGAVTNQGVISAVTYTPLTGRTCPFNIIDSNSGSNQSGFQIGAGTTSAAKVLFTGSVDGTNNNLLTGNGVASPNARIVCPYYIANPKVDSALTMTKTFSTYEKIVNPILASADQTVNYTITVGVANPRRLVLIPFYQNMGGATLPNPEYSAFDSVPATSSPFAFLKNLQVQVGNRNIYQTPINYGFEQWIQENSGLGLNGNMIDESTSGLLSQQLWETNHRFYSVDLSRRLSSEDGTSKSVQVSFTNGSPNYAMKVIAIVYYEKKYTINTSQCLITSA